MTRSPNLNRRDSVVLWPRDRARPSAWDFVPLGEVMVQQKRPIAVSNEATYHLIGMRWYAKGPYIKEVLPGAAIKADQLFAVESGDFIYNRLFAWKGSFGVVEQDCAHGVVSGEFPCFRTADPSDAYFLWMLFAQPFVWNVLEVQSAGSTSISRLRLKEVVLTTFLVPWPKPPERRRITEILRAQMAAIACTRSALRQQANALEELALALLRRGFNGSAE